MSVPEFKMPRNDLAQVRQGSEPSAPDILSRARASDRFIALHTNQDAAATLAVKNAPADLVHRSSRAQV